MQYDLAIIGGGPAGIAGGVYAARKHLQTVFIAGVVGGQSAESGDVQNWIGTPHISGQDLAKALESHLREYADGFVDLKIGERAKKIEKTANIFQIQTDKNSYSAKTVLLATGGTRKKLQVPGAARFENKGVTYCASCDGPLFAGQDVVVIGGGNAGFETAAQLLAYAKSVTLVHRGAEFSKADATTVKAVLAHPNMKPIRNAEPVEIKGGQFVEAVAVKDIATGALTDIPAAGVFVEIGMFPSTDLAKGLVEFDEWGRIKVDGKSQRASALGIWAAGDCSDGLYHQNNIAAGDAVKATEDIYYYLSGAASELPALGEPVHLPV